MKAETGFLARTPENAGEPISQTLLKRLSVVVIAALLITLGVSWVIETRMSKENAQSILRINIEDVQQDIIDASDENLLALTKQVAHDVKSVDNATPELLESLMESYDVSEIDVIDNNGIITACTNPDFVGYDMSSGAQSAEFMVLLDGTSQYVQSYQPISYDNSISRKYAGVAFPSGGFIQVAYDAERFQQDIDKQVVGVTRNRHVGESGCIIIADEKWRIVSDRHGNEGKRLSASGILVSDLGNEWEIFSANAYGEKSTCMYAVAEGYYIIAELPENEVVLQRDTSIAQTAVAMIVVFLILALVIFLLVRMLVVNSINRVNDSLAKITEGNLDEVVDVRSNTEFSSLSDDINTTVNTLKRYISEAETRIDAELAVAKAIQESALPQTFPPYPDIPKFDIFASMTPAREVGGDFYDFFLIGDDCTPDCGKVGFVMADVSGKGIPASLFMMKANTLIRDYLETGISPGEAIENANRQLCDGNEAGMFVTVWVGVLDYGTGHLEYTNAGHNPPLLWQDGVGWTWLTEKSGMPLGLFDGLPYKMYSLECQPGDQLLLYTDGVTEALNEAREFYGEDRLEALVAKVQTLFPHDLVQAVLADVAAYAGEAEQSDDITILALKFGVPPEVTAKLTVPAVDAELDHVNDFIHTELDQRRCPKRAQNQLDIAVEELFVNIAHYAYPEATAENPGMARISCTYSTTPPSVTVELADDGIPFDPLAKPDAVLSDNIEEINIGGLGILMAKKSVDEITYERRDESNVVTIVKKW